MVTKVFRNTTKQVIKINNIDEVKPGEQISYTGEYLQPIVLANYPGLVEVTDEPSPQDKKEHAAWKESQGGKV